MFPDQDGYDDSYDHNVDIEFTAVMYLDIPTTLNGITITEISSGIPEKLVDYAHKLGSKIYEIQSGGQLYYIAAGGYLIGTSKWISEDRIQDMNLKYDEIIGSSVPLK